TNLGLAAFTAKEYGRAAQRFRQATAVEPALPRAHFLLAQAEFALGKYRSAVNAIHAGMRLQANWPNAAFQPRRELYKGKEEASAPHLKRREDVQKNNPEEPASLSLLPYQLCFDGRRDDALPLFRRARPLAPDPAFIDQFLRAAAPGPVAAR